MCDVVWKETKEKIKVSEYEKWTKGICEDIVDKAMLSGSNDNLSCVFIAFKHYFNVLNKERCGKAKENVKKVKCDNKLIESVIDVDNDVSRKRYESVFDKTNMNNNSDDSCNSNDNDNNNKQQQQHQYVFKSYYSQFNNVDPKKTSLENYYGV